MAYAIIGASNLDLPPRMALRGSTDAYLELLHGGGFDIAAGYEWSDMRFLAARRAGRELAQLGLIASVHESWNEDTPMQAFGNGLMSVAIAAVFPRLDKSYGQLAGIQALSGQPLPIVVHPPGQHLGEVSPKRPRMTISTQQFAARWYQPTVEWAVSRGIVTNTVDTPALAEHILQEQAVAGLDKIALDLHHLTSKRNNLRFAHPVELAAALAKSGTLAEVQVSIRPDFGGDQSELKAACNGHLANTQTGEMLSAIAAQFEPTQPLRVISEIAASEIAGAGQKDLAAAHSTINASIRELLS